MPLPPELSDRLNAFRETSRFRDRGGVVTDLDGTALHEHAGRVYVAEPVAEGLKALVELGRPVVVNTLRFPLNVIRTFGQEWSAITREPVPLVSLNGAIFGMLTPLGRTDTIFEEVSAFPLSSREIEEAMQSFQGLVDDESLDVAVFVYPRDWRQGELIWSFRADRVDTLRAKYKSASSVLSGRLEDLQQWLLVEEICMLSIQAEASEDRRMVYQQTNPNRFVTTAGVDKLSGAREAAARLDFDLDQSVGAGDTPMDRFLAGVGLALQVGPMVLSFQGRQDTLRLETPFQLGSALFELARADASGASA